MATSSPFHLVGKVALITGAASGIGLATARLFLQSGVLGLVLIDPAFKNFEETAGALSPADRERCELIEADVSVEEAVRGYVNRAVERWGRLDISVLNAGLMRVNGLGVFLGIKHSGQIMLKNPGGPTGSIVIISSQLGLEGAPGLSAYSASKFAARGLALTAAEELTPLGIRVNSVCPGPISTPLLDVFERESWSSMADKTLLGRLGRPEEIARAVLYLASDGSSFCAGTTLKVDGGYAKFG